MLVNFLQKLERQRGAILGLGLGVGDQDHLVSPNHLSMADVTKQDSRLETLY